jgi:hypothetical protein
MTRKILSRFNKNLLNDYLGFLPISCDMDNILKGNEEIIFQWMIKQHSFNMLKFRLCFASILAVLEVYKPFKPKMNAYVYVMGIVLIQ